MAPIRALLLLSLAQPGCRTAEPETSTEPRSFRDSKRAPVVHSWARTFER